MTELLERRIDDTLAHDGHASCQLAVALLAWDPEAHEKVDLVFERALELPAPMNCAPSLAIDRFRHGDRFALDRYAERITLQQILADFELAEPLWRYLDDPSMVKASERLFASVRLFEGSSPGPAYRLLDRGELLRVRAFRQTVLAALDDPRDVATSRANHHGGTLIYDDGNSIGWGVCGCGAPSPMVVKRLRVCDIVTADLAVHEARFAFERPIRDQSDEVTAMKAFLEAFETAAP